MLDCDTVVAQLFIRCFGDNTAMQSFFVNMGQTNIMKVMRVGEHIVPNED